MVGLSGLEPPTPSLSETYSNQLSYKPIQFIKLKGDEKKKLVCI